MSFKLCPCCSKKSFDDCCKDFLTDIDIPSTPESLMRSRFTAFVSGNVDYLYQTSSEALKQQISQKELQQTCDAFQFVYLEILKCNKSTVEFIAHLLLGNEHHKLHEHSTVIKENQLWKYDSGTLYDTPVNKLGRNDQCPCASGKKFKKCHMV